MTRFTPRMVLATCLLAPVAACSDTSAPDPLAPSVNASVVEFNPQPEPPPLLSLPFEASGDFTTRMTGFVEFPGGLGEVLIIIINGRTAGQEVHVEQIWEIVPPEPVVPPDPIVPPEPIFPPEPIEPFALELMGIVNLANGRVVLNGKGDGFRARVDATLVGGMLKGDLSIFGFNPQPEPPPGS